MKTRIISGLVMVPLLSIVYFGKLPLTIGCMIISLIGVKEFFTMYENKGIKPSKYLAYIMILILYALHVSIGFKPYIFMAWIFISIAMSLIYGLDIVNRGPDDSIATMAGLMYLGFFPYHIVLLDGTVHRLMIWMIFIAAFGSDIFAYFIGCSFGKHKMAPNLSPKKSIEGAIGGIAGAGILGLIFGMIFLRSLWYHCLIVGLIGGVISECGDLVASSFKRQMGIKDYGNLIPGHGGIMDRFDSVIFVAPVVYYYVIFAVLHI